MASSKCSKCDNSYFEVVENSPRNSNYKLIFVQCSSCGSVVGTMDYYNIGTKLRDIEGKIDRIKSEISDISYDVDIIKRKRG